MSRAGAWVAAGLLCLVAACGVPADSAPRSIPAEEVPFGLLGTTTTATTRAPATTTALVFLVDGDRLAPVRRQVAEPATPTVVLAALAAGPTAEEAAGGLGSAVVTEGSVGQVAAGTATVRLDRDFAAGLSGQVLALAQLVYTITELPGIGGVQFTFDGQPAEIPTANGSTKTGVATRADYAAIGPAG